MHHMLSQLISQLISDPYVKRTIAKPGTLNPGDLLLVYPFPALSFGTVFGMEPDALVRVTHVLGHTVLVEALSSAMCSGTHALIIEDNTFVVLT